MKKTIKQKQSRLTEYEMCQRLGKTKGDLRKDVKEGLIPKPKHTNKGPRYELSDERRSAYGIRPLGLFQRIRVGGEV